jgi:multiple sugar transport system substrate-binding protein
VAAGLFAAAGLCLGGCGRRAGEDGEIRLTFWSRPWWGEPLQYQDPDGPHIPAIDWQKQRIAEYERDHPGVRIRREIDPGEDKMRLAFASRTAPDVFFAGVNSEIMRYAEMGFLEPIDAYLRPEDEADIWPAALDAGSLGGQRFLWPLYNHALVILVNQTLCEERGVAELLPAGDGEWTFDTFMEIARALTIDRDADGRPETYGVGIPALGEIHYILTSYLVNFGARVFDPDRGLVINSPETRAALDFLREIQGPDGVAPPGAAGYRFLDVRDLFFSQKVGMMLGNAGLIDYGHLQMETGRIKPFRVRMTAIPTRDLNTPSISYLTVGAVAVARQTDPEKREAAMELARWVTSPPMNKWFWSKWASPRKSTPLPEDPNLRTMMLLVSRSQNFLLPPVALHPRYDLTRQVDLFYQDVFSGQLSIDTALANFEGKFYRDGLRGVENWPSSEPGRP